MSKIFYRVNEFKDEVLSSRELIFERGYLCGFHSGNEYISYKKGFTSYFYAHPFSGKTSFILDQMVYIATKYGCKIAIYSSEGGDKNVLVSALVQVVLGKKLHGSNKSIVSIDEWITAMDFIDKHFVIIDPDLVSKDAEKFSAKTAFNTVKLARKEYGWDIDIFVIDPFNYLMRDADQMKMSVADYTLDTLMFINKASHKMGLHTIICMHLRDDDLIEDKETGVSYMPRPYPSKIMNGQNVWRAAQAMIGLWRLPETVMEKGTGYPYPTNGTDILIQKNKIFGSGKGKGEFRLFFDDNKQKFYEEIDYKRYYIGEYESYFNNTNVKQIELKPNRNFDGPF